jgi:hypothetical protein
LFDADIFFSFILRTHYERSDFMREAFDEESLTAMKRAYDEVLHDLFGDTPPGQRVREGIACAILYSAKAGEDDWQKMAAHAGAQTLNMLRNRAVLMRRELHSKADAA